jgi:hypothetical protein
VKYPKTPGAYLSDVGIDHELVKDESLGPVVHNHIGHDDPVLPSPRSPSAKPIE